jgi:hypothetical protein
LKRFIEVIGPTQYRAIMRKPPYWRIQYAIGASCEFPGCTTTGQYGKLVFDHCHLHGWIRGLVCTSHNIKIGQVEAVAKIEGIIMDLSGTLYAAFFANCQDCEQSVPLPRDDRSETSDG